MKKFKFYQDVKVSVWRRQKFEIEAESYVEALKEVEKFKTEDVGKWIDVYEYETLFDTEELLYPHNNNGFPTIKLYDKNEKLLGNN
jgi:hypothetical protein